MLFFRLFGYGKSMEFWSCTLGQCVCTHTYLYVKGHMQTAVCIRVQAPALVPLHLQGGHSDAAAEC